MPKINIYLPDELAAAVRDAQLPVSAICQSALERAVRDVSALRSSDEAPVEEPAYGPFMRFTPRARQAVAHAQSEAREHTHDHVDTEHVLLGILDEGENLALKVLDAMDVEAEDLRSEVVASLPPDTKRPRQRVPFAPLAKKALEASTKEAHGLGHNYIGCEHLLLGLLATEDGLASQVLRRMGVELRTTRRAVLASLSGFVNGREQQLSRPAVPSSVLNQILQRLDAIERRLAS
jgi:ATP-dependent Clp protease ATP-binding subunit ClpA